MPAIIGLPACTVVPRVIRWREPGVGKMRETVNFVNFAGRTRGDLGGFRLPPDPYRSRRPAASNRASFGTSTSGCGWPVAIAASRLKTKARIAATAM